MNRHYLYFNYSLLNLYQVMKSIDKGFFHIRDCNLKDTTIQEDINTYLTNQKRIQRLKYYESKVILN